MKKLLSIAVLILTVSTTVFSQIKVEQEEIDYYQSLFGMEKKMVVANFLQLEESDAFWALYNEYEKERKILGQKRLDAILDYAENYEKLTDDKTDDLIKKSITHRKSVNDIIVKYYKKVKKTSGSKTAAQFYQIENYFVTAVGAQMYTAIPLIGELD